MEGYRYVRGGPKDVVTPQINRKTALDLTHMQAPVDEALQTSICEEGVIPRAIRELFSQVEKKRKEQEGKSKICVRVQYI